MFEEIASGASGDMGANGSSRMLCTTAWLRPCVLNHRFHASGRALGSVHPDNIMKIQNRDIRHDFSSWCRVNAFEVVNAHCHLDALKKIPDRVVRQDFAGGCRGSGFRPSTPQRF